LFLHNAAKSEIRFDATHGLPPGADYRTDDLFFSRDFYFFDLVLKITLCIEKEQEIMHQGDHHNFSESLLSLSFG